MSLSALRLRVVMTENGFDTYLNSRSHFEKQFSEFCQGAFA